jgi:hypothetical protein
MSDDTNWAEEIVGVFAADDDNARGERIRRLSDQELARYYAVLSDSRYARNVSFLLLLEEELRVRGLALGRHH